MKRLVQLLWDFVKHDFHFRTFLLVIVWAAILLTINYSIELEDNYIDALPTNGLRFLGYLALYTTAYYTSIYLVFLSKGKGIEQLTGKFWLISLLGIAIFSADSGFVLHQYVIDWISPKSKLYGFYFAVLSNATEFLTIALPLFLVNYFLISSRADNLGFNKKEIDLAPFFIILLIIAPFIFFSAFERGLNNYYPTFRYGGAAKALGIVEWLPIAIYEFFYGLDFFNVELMFRGFMVIGLVTILGRDAVLPMAVLYCTIHFGKPLAEAVSSILGGYILGAIAYQTRSVWGGVIVHIGLAWLMEASAFCVKEIQCY